MRILTLRLHLESHFLPWHEACVFAVGVNFDGLKHPFYEGGNRGAMASTDSKHGSENAGPGQSEWSHRRSAAVLLAGGVVFWAIVLLVLVELGFF